MMTRDQIQTVLDALEYIKLHVPFSDEDGTMYSESAIAILTAALAEPSEPHAWEYTNVQSGFKQLQSYPPEHFEEFNDMEMWHVKPLFTHPASNQLDEIAKVLHYPDCWDVMAYPTLEDAIIEAKSWAHCTNDDCQCPTKEA